jgi:hypothetical protein
MCHFLDFGLFIRLLKRLLARFSRQKVGSGSFFGQSPKNEPPSPCERGELKTVWIKKKDPLSINALFNEMQKY